MKFLRSIIILMLSLLSTTCLANNYYGSSAGIHSCTHIDTTRLTFTDSIKLFKNGRMDSLFLKTLGENALNRKEIAVAYEIINQYSKRYSKTPSRDGIKFLLRFVIRPKDIAFNILSEQLKYNMPNELNKIISTGLQEIVFKNQTRQLLGVHPNLSALDKVVKSYPQFDGEYIYWSTVIEYVKAVISRERKGTVENLIKVANFYDEKFKDGMYNKWAWLIFENSNKKKYLAVALQWSKKELERTPPDNPDYGMFLDTYANILYKLGRKEEAIQYEQKAVNAFPNDDGIKVNLRRMQLGQETWPKDSIVEFSSAVDFTSIINLAKQESKMIFLDFIATWCGPCKEMDKYVYSDKVVGEILNNNFISVKIQTDKTKYDTSYIKKWHQDVAALMEKYEVKALPTLVFLNSDGKLIKKIAGAVDADTFIKTTEEVLSSK